ncbi:MAG: GFA family protein [Pseudomonadota bacterium]
MSDIKPTEPSAKLTGRCLCGAVSYQVNANEHVDVCHCKMCRRWSGGPVFAVEANGRLEIAGQDNLAVYNSSEWGERCFCKTCGTNLFWRAPSMGFTAVMAGSLDDEQHLKLTKQIFIDHKAPYFSFANETENLTEAQVIALFAGTEGSSGGG